MATHSSILAWRIPCTEECRGFGWWGLQFMGLQRVGHGTQMHTSIHPHLHIHTGKMTKLR